MSLRAFHILFIILSVVLAFWCGMWGISPNVSEPSTARFAFGVVSFVLGVLLAGYGVWFVRKTKKLIL